jgi:CRISPR-associated protein Csh1
LKDTEYVIFYLDEPVASYRKANERYLVDKLFNTNEYNSTIEEEVFGTSDFFNGFNSKKPYLTHQSATFDIPGRISSKEARALYEFGDIIGRGILPRPLPLFLYKDELKQEAIALFKKEAESNNRISFQKL